MVQDLQIINEAVVPLASHGTKSLSNLLGDIPPNTKWFTLLDLKDIFFCITLVKESQYLLA